MENTTKNEESSGEPANKKRKYVRKAKIVQKPLTKRPTRIRKQVKPFGSRLSTKSHDAFFLELMSSDGNSSCSSTPMGTQSSQMILNYESQTSGTPTTESKTSDKSSDKSASNSPVHTPDMSIDGNASCSSITMRTQLPQIILNEGGQTSSTPSTESVTGDSTDANSPVQTPISHPTVRESTSNEIHTVNLRDESSSSQRETSTVETSTMNILSDSANSDNKTLEVSMLKYLKEILIRVKEIEKNVARLEVRQNVINSSLAQTRPESFVCQEIGSSDQIELEKLGLPINSLMKMGKFEDDLTQQFYWNSIVSETKKSNKPLSAHLY